MLQVLRIGFFLFVISTCTACARHDLRSLCQLAKDVLSEPRHQPAARFAVFATQVGEAMVSGRAKAAVEGLKPLAPAARYPAMRAFAAELGESQWRCSELETIVSFAASAD